MKYAEFIKTAKKDTVKEIDLMIKEFNINKNELTITTDDSLASITEYNLKWGKNSTWLIENN